MKKLICKSKIRDHLKKIALLIILLASCFYASANNWTSLESAVDSSGCQISNLTMSTVDLGTDMFEVTIDFDYINTSTTFDLEILTDYIGTYNYSDLPITVGPLSCVFLAVDPFIMVSDSDTLSCTGEITSPPISPCNGASCLVEIISISADCDTIGGASQAVLNINTIGPGGVSNYSVWVDGVSIEDGLDYQVDYTIDLPADGITSLVQVVDVDSTCLDSYSLFIPDCSQQTPSCNVAITGAEAYCDGGLTFIDFELSQGLPPFTFLLDSMPIASMVYNPPTYTFEVPSTSSLTTSLEVIDVNACMDTQSIALPLCDSSYCDIYNLTMSPEIVGPDLFELTIDFDHNNSSGTFELDILTSYIGTYNYADLPITVGPFSCVFVAVAPFLSVADSDSLSCNAEIVSPPFMGCGDPDCIVSNEEITSIECADSSSYTVTIDFDYVATGASGFIIGASPGSPNFIGEGDYSWGALPLELGPLPLNSDTICIDIMSLDSVVCSSVLCIPPVQCILPGDTDGDSLSLANNIDLLRIGLAYGESGPVRIDQSIDFSEKAFYIWEGSFDNGRNFGHADCDGNGVINEDDLLAIDQNYMLNPAADAVVSTFADAPLFLDLPDSDLIGGSTITVPIVLGSASLPITDLYGLAFTILYDSDIIVPGTMTIDFSDSFLGSGSDVISISKVFEYEEKIDLAICRTTGAGVDGYGDLGTATFALIENIEGKMPSSLIPIIFEIANLEAITPNEQSINFDATAETGQVVSGISELSEHVEISIGPNPSTEYIHLENKLSSSLSISVINSQGQVIKQHHTSAQAELIDIDNLSTGVYIVLIDDGEKRFSERIVINK